MEGIEGVWEDDALVFVNDIVLGGVRLALVDTAGYVNWETTDKQALEISQDFFQGVRIV